MNILKLVKVIRDVYSDKVSRDTVEACRELEKAEGIWRNVSAVRYIAGVPEGRSDYKNIAKEAREELEDDLCFR